MLKKKIKVIFKIVANLKKRYEFYALREHAKLN